MIVCIGIGDTTALCRYVIQPSFEQRLQEDRQRPRRRDLLNVDELV